MSDIVKVNILDEIENTFLTYAEEVLVDRAIPYAEDGLLSAQRKILWTAIDYMKLKSNSKYKKSASLVANTLLTSYFHGDAACYGVLCKMAQKYLMRYPLIDSEDNMGSQESNGMEAASRYTNARPSIFADLMMNQYEKNVVPTKITYNSDFYEPVVLPSFFPNALCNGHESIGVAISSNTLPANLTEVCEAIVAFLKNKDLTTKDLMNYMKGPDFPLGNVVINSKDIYTAFDTGKSKVSLKVRGDYTIEKNKIIFTSIPYRVYRDKIKKQINDNIDVFNELLDDFEDLSGIGKNKLVFTVKSGVNPEAVVLKLFALTDLQTTLSYNMNFIVNGTPKQCSMLDLIRAYVEHQENVMIRAAEFDKEKAEKRKHILEGILIALKDIDKAIELIKTSSDKKEAAQRLIEYFKITDTQANAILDLKLSKITRLDRDELLKELEEKVNQIAECVKIITEAAYRDECLIEKVTELKNKYGDARRTQLLNIEVPKDEAPEVIPEDVVVILDTAGNLKRISKSSFKVQKRNGKGVKSTDTAVVSTFATNTQDKLLLFSNSGKMYQLLVDNIPACTNAAKGTNVSTLIKMEYNEKIVAASSLTLGETAKYIVFVTKQGMFKKTALEEYTGIKRNTGIQAIKLKEGDSIVNVSFVNEPEYIVFTKQGMSIHFETKDIRPIGRATMGVKTIKLAENDYVIAAVPLADRGYIAIFTEDGLGKVCYKDEFPLQLTNGKGVMASHSPIVNAFNCEETDEILIIGQPTSICIKASELPNVQRTSGGNRVIKDSHIISVACM